MDVSELVAAAIEGNADAFTELVQRYQTMAFGYAYATLGDFHLAEDATQQAFLVAYRNLTSLRDPERFGGWLRGITRYESLRLLRVRRMTHVSLDDTFDIASSAPGPDELAEEQASFERALAAVNALPEPERIAAVLYYIQDRSQRDVAQFLNLPVSTVNNRLRSARNHLREGGFLTMTQDALRHHDLPEDFAKKIGEVVRSSGPIIEARFRNGVRPPLLSSVTIGDEPAGLNLTAQVAQYLDDDLVRLVSVSVPDSAERAVRPGLPVVDAGQPVSLPLDDASLLRLIPDIRRAQASRTGAVLETGIKAVDVFSPLPPDGMIGLVGDMQSGKMVLVEELIQRLGESGHRLTLLVFVQSPAEVTAIQKLDYRVSGMIQAIYLPVADASPEALARITGQLDATITISSRLAAARLYPAIDPTRSTSALLDPTIVGEKHIDAVERVKNLLAREPEIAERESKGTGDDARAWSIRRYLTQPFYVAEAFTNRKGSTVPRSVAVADLLTVLDGSGTDLPEDALYMNGSLAEAREAHREHPG